MGLRQALTLGVVAVIGALGTSADASQGASPGHNGSIAITFYPTEMLAFVSPQGRVTKKVKRWTHRNYNPAWSPDGRRLAYGHFRGGGEEGGVVEAWVADPSGRPLKRLVDETESWANCSAPADNNLSWTPDGSRLLFSAARMVTKDPLECEMVPSLWTVSKNGGNPVRLLAAEGPRWDRCTGFSAPAWSPKGEIAFVGSEFLGDDHGMPICRSNIFVVHRDGSGLRQLTHT